MPVLHNIQYEQFAVAVSQGVPKIDAARMAGFGKQNPHNTAQYLYRRTEIRERIDELRAEALAAAALVEDDPIPEEEVPTRPWIVGKYMTAVRLSEAREDRASMIRALDSIAKLEGYMIDRTETRTGPLDSMGAGDLQAMIDFIQNKKKAITVEARVAPPLAPVAPVEEPPIAQPREVGDE